MLLFFTKQIVLFVFLDIDPINEGHILITPKEHILDLDDMSDYMSDEIMRLSKMLLKALRLCYDFKGYTIMQNGGIFNDLGHYHMHLVPRYEDDGFGWTYGANIPDAYNEAVAKSLKNAITKLN